MRARRTLCVVALLLLSAGGGLLGRRVYIEAKALLAHLLIERALAAHLRDGAPHRPWAWADTYPIAVLTIDRLHVRRPVLAGASGTSLAFGAGHIDGTAPPNGPGHTVLAGHRDREFEFLRDLLPGDVPLHTFQAAGHPVGARLEFVLPTHAALRQDHLPQVPHPIAKSHGPLPRRGTVPLRRPLALSLEVHRDRRGPWGPGIAGDHEFVIAPGGIGPSPILKKAFPRLY